MRAGTLRHRVTIERPVDARDGFGQAVHGWETFATRWAEVRGLSGRELFEAQQNMSRATHTVRMRDVSGVTTDMRIKDDRNRYLNILSALDAEGRSRETVFVCAEDTGSVAT